MVLSDNPTITGGCRIFAGGSPKLTVSNVNGHLKIVFIPDSTNNNIKNPLITFNFDTADLGLLSVEDFSGIAKFSLIESPVLMSLG